MSIENSYRQNWQNPDAFSRYDERRVLVTGALNEQIAQVLSDNFASGDTLVEIGSGDGAMRYYAGDSRNHYNWVETDQSHLFLSLSRTQPPARVQATSAHLPFAEGTIDGVIGFSMLDALSTDDLAATANSAQDVLKDDGKVVHILDMSPDIMAEMENAKATHEFPIPYNETPGSPMGLVFLRIKNRHILAKIQSLPQPQSVRNTLCNLIEHPETIMQMANGTTVLPYLGNVVAESGLASRKIPNWIEYFGQKLADVFSSQGFVVIQNDLVQTKTLQDRRIIPVQYRSARYIVRQQGVVSLYDGLEVAVQGKTVVEADAHVFVAQKAA